MEMYKSKQNVFGVNSRFEMLIQSTLNCFGW